MLHDFPFTYANHIEPRAGFFSRALQPESGRTFQSLYFQVIHTAGRIESIGAGSRFDFDENDDSKPPRNDVDFSTVRAHIPSEDSISTK